MTFKASSPFSYAVLNLIAIGLASFLRAFVAMKLWAWFLVPLGVPPIPSFAFAYGVLLAIGYFTQSKAPNLTEVETRKAIDYPPERAIVFGVVLDLTVLGVGWAAHYLAS